MDIKPYIPYADSFSNSKTGWLIPNINYYSIVMSSLAKKQSDWLDEYGDFNIENYCKVQLQVDPENYSRKRILKTDDFYSGKRVSILKFRTWLIAYTVDHENKEVHVDKISSLYSHTDLQNLVEDKKKDKGLHNKFISCFYD